MADSICEVIWGILLLVLGKTMLHEYFSDWAERHFFKLNVCVASKDAKNLPQSKYGPNYVFYLSVKLKCWSVCSGQLLLVFTLEGLKVTECFNELDLWWIFTFCHLLRSSGCQYFPMELQTMHMCLLSVITVCYSRTRVNSLDGVTLFYITVLFLTAPLCFVGDLVSLKADLTFFFK